MSIAKFSWSSKKVFFLRPYKFRVIRQGWVSEQAVDCAVNSGLFRSSPGFDGSADEKSHPLCVPYEGVPIDDSAGPCTGITFKAGAYCMRLRVCASTLAFWRQ